MIPEWARDRLRCPLCKGELESPEGDINCLNCDYSAAGVSDFRPRAEGVKTISLETKFNSDPETEISGIELTPPEAVNGGPVPRRDSSELLGEMRNRLGKDATVLDLGCGPKDQKAPVEYLGFRYVGGDYCHPESDLLLDAQALPFADGSFDCVLSYAVLEHVPNPFLALDEVSRVLKPGGLFVGTVSQGEPFHSSYFHHTPWGLLSLVSSQVTLETVRIWKGQGTLPALSRMGRYPGPVRQLLALAEKLKDVSCGLSSRRKAMTPRERQLDGLYEAGSLGFSIVKSRY